MNSYLFYAPRFRPLSPDGETIPGAYIQFYASGTTDPEDVFSDSGLETELSNPVVADASGEFPAIYLSPTVTYRALLFDADDSLIWDEDPLAPPRDVEPGTIFMFFGTEEQRDAAYPPTLYQLCNGDNGSPDMRDRFPVGVSSTKALGDTGGASSGTTSSAGGHNHGGSTSSVVLSAAQMPAHNHRLWCSTAGSRFRAVGWHANRDVVSVAGSDGDLNTYIDEHNDSEPLIQESGEGDPEGHDHEISSVDDHTHSVDTLPPYVALYYVMRRFPS